MPDFPGKSRLQRAWQSGLRALDLDGIGKPKVTAGIELYRAQMPPRLLSIHILGNLTDETGADYHGANGRSSVVGGRVYYALNKDPADAGATGEAPIGFAHNTMAMATDPENNPLAVATCGKDSNGVEWRFMPLVNVEKYYVYDTPHSMLLYLTGGMCEYSEGDGRGYVWCERWVREPRDNGRVEDVYKGTAIGLGTVDQNTGHIFGERLGYGEIIFKKGEPSFGTFCAVEDNMWYYTFGKQGENVYLARVSKQTPITPRLYQTWDGHQFSEYRERITPVFSGYSHGTVFRTSLFGGLYKWAFIGLSSRGERTVDIGLAENIWGPYKMSEIINPRMLPEGHEMTSSLFVHTWAFKEDMGQLMITWNDGNTGKIVGARLQFAMRE